ncbi:5-oxoprolinase/urea amidolyase family protein [Pelistega sp. NLN82]|uniref:5-oxoprolinase/urea amidolyase family protein n=1 Tax=Pelistega ratti TaxID=2652177 RepID=A0A6L9Y3S1_9BURK|nr:5-oxoprolinase/urea amidolyase family protein [Pelistega ratti]NEN74785.1 5-oxoprolinase/urea amidolyase family protein [Pelistega ratti]
MMEVLAVSSRATIQDIGRFGLREFGISQCGAMDKLALKAGNLLLGNEENTPAIEVPLGGISLKFHEAISFCVTGAFYEMTLDDEPIFTYWRYQAKAGQVLKLHHAKIGMYGYLCVRGGFDIPKELNSCSTDVRAKLGGINGRILAVGDQLLTKNDGLLLQKVGIAPIPLKNTIYALPSSEYQAFTRKSQYNWWQTKWTLQSNSDRMGYRFQGAVLNLEKPLEMLSHAIQFGSVQVPPNGQPIILMADAQTTGGYPKIAHVIDADLGALAQVRLGTAIQFEAVDLAQAAKLRRKNDVYLDQIRSIVDEAY